MQYIIDSFKNAGSTVVNDITILEFENFFSKEHLEQLMWATKQINLIDSSDPLTGKKPSAIDFSKLVKYEFFRDLQTQFRSKEFKTTLLTKFGINDVDYFADYLEVGLSIHTDQGHQFDDAHSDQKNNLFSLTF